MSEKSIEVTSFQFTMGFHEYILRYVLTKVKWKNILKVWGYQKFEMMIEYIHKTSFVLRKVLFYIELFREGWISSFLITQFYPKSYNPNEY